MISDKHIIEKSNKITILFLSWRDIKAPKKGGAEVYTHEMLKRVDFEKYEIIHFSPQFEGSKSKEVIDNILYLREGGVLSVIKNARKFYNLNKDRIDFVVDQCNTHRFFTKFWVEHKKRIFFIHQLTREIWYLNAKFPISTIGFFTETPFLRLSRKDYTMTVSESTKKDLLEIGFDSDKVTILPEGINFEHWKKEQFLPKDEHQTFTYVGRFVNYKGIDDTVEAYAKLKKVYPDIKLWIIGKKDETYIKNVLKPIFESNNLSYGEPNENKDVTFHGFIDGDKKLELMSRSKALVFPSKREGWGLIVTEAAAVGTPSIVYNSPGTIDAVNFGQAGYLCNENTVESIYSNMKRVIENPDEYEKYRNNAYEFSLNFHWNNTAESFEKFIDKIINQ